MQGLESLGLRDLLSVVRVRNGAGRRVVNSGGFGHTEDFLVSVVVCSSC